MTRRAIRTRALLSLGALTVFIVSYLLFGKLIVSSLALGASLTLILTWWRAKHVRSRPCGDPDYYIRR